MKGPGEERRARAVPAALRCRRSTAVSPAKRQKQRCRRRPKSGNGLPRGRIRHPRASGHEGRWLPGVRGAHRACAAPSAIWSGRSVEHRATYGNGGAGGWACGSRADSAVIPSCTVGAVLPALARPAATRPFPVPPAPAFRARTQALTTCRGSSKNHPHLWGSSSAGRASPSQGGGRGFKSLLLHQEFQGVRARPFCSDPLFGHTGLPAKPMWGSCSMTATFCAFLTCW